MEPILEVKNLKMHYISKTQSIRAVQDVSFAIGKGETFGLVGESGCGKSATCRTVLRLLPETGKILEGSVRFDGQELTTLSQQEMCKIRGGGISMIFQEPMTALNPVLTIKKQLYEAFHRQKLPAEELYRRSIQMLQMVDIPEPEKRMKQYIHQCSGGMRQRIMIAIALASQPRLLLADEPTTALDVTIQHQIIRLINRLKRELQMSIVLITHDLGVVRQMCDNVAVMYAGYLVEVTDNNTLFAQPRHPYTLGLIRSLPQEEGTGRALEPIPGMPPSLLEDMAGCPFRPRCKYATERCALELPALRELQPGHQIRCHNAEHLAVTGEPAQTEERGAKAHGRRKRRA